MEKVWNFIQSCNHKLKGITLIYNALNSKDIFTKYTPLLKWEKKLGKEFSELQWKMAIKCNLQFSRCSNYEELAQKLTQRWYFTPYIVAKFSKDKSNLCWRGCGQVGTLTHMVWSCVSLRDFWTEIFNLISKVMGIPIKPNIEQAILSSNVSNFPAAVRSIMTNILLAAHSGIMYRWKSSDIPKVSDILSKLNIIAEYERILENRDDNYSKFELNWSMWRSYSLTC